MAARIACNHAHHVRIGCIFDSGRLKVRFCVLSISTFAECGLDCYNDDRYWYFWIGVVRLEFGCEGDPPSSCGVAELVPSNHQPLLSAWNWASRRIPLEQIEILENSYGILLSRRTWRK